jgi:hypothetical protein
MEKIARGSGLGVKKEEIKPLCNLDILKLVKYLKIKHYRGVFMKDVLPQKVKSIECGIINLEESDEEGSHWTAYNKNFILTLMEILVFQNNLLNT